MSFPRISTKATNITITPKLEAILDQKFEPLGKFLKNVSDARCEVELERIGEHQSGKIFRAEINLFWNGKMYRAEATEEQIEQAIDEIRDELKRELQKDGERHHSLVRRGAQTLKNMMRFGK